MSKQQHRKPTRPQHEPQTLPATTGNAARQQSPVIVAPNEATILKLLSDKKVKQAMSVRLGKIFGVDEMIAMVATNLRQSPLLAKCDPMTIVGAVLEVAQVGLRLDRALGQAYLVPFFSSKRNVHEAVLVIGYRGMITMAEHAERVQAVRAKIVFERDRFEYEEGLEPRLLHKPDDTRERGRPTHVYSVVHKTGGLAIPYVMPWWKIEDLRDAQVKRGNTIWQSNTEEMGLKTTIRRGLKYHPLAPRQQRVVNLDELGEEGVDQELGIIGASALDAIAANSDDAMAALEQSRVEAGTPAKLATPDDDRQPEGQQPQQGELRTDGPGDLSPAEQEAFEASQRGDKP